MGDDEGLGGFLGARLDAVDEMGEDDLGKRVSKGSLMMIMRRECSRFCQHR